MTSDNQDAIMRFYRLKSEYESKDRTKCINCQQLGGSIFHSKYDDRAEGRVLLARCGHTSAPCPLNIRINLGVTMRIDEMAAEAERNLHETKQRIVLNKNNVMFGYSTPAAALAEFERLKEELAGHVEVIEGLFDDQVAVNHEKIRLLKQQIQDYIYTIKTTPITDETVKTLVDDITPLTRLLRETMWPVCFVHSDADQIVLVQRASKLESVEITTSAFPVGVERFDVGNQRPKGQTIRAKTTPPMSASKTRRRSPALEPVPEPNRVEPTRVEPEPEPQRVEPEPNRVEPNRVESEPNRVEPEPNRVTGPEWIPNTGKRCPPGYLVDRKDKTRCIKKKQSGGNDEEEDDDDDYATIIAATI